LNEQEPVEIIFSNLLNQIDKKASMVWFFYFCWIISSYDNTLR
jgi:hypothetical protein